MNIDSLRELAVLDGERLQALWDEIGRLNAPQAPIAKIVVDESDGLMTMLYAPGLPPGEHDVYCTPWAPYEYWRPIDTCPANTRVLLWYPQLGYPVTGMPEAYGYATGGWKATFWMPLPASPANSTSAHKGA